MRFAEIKPKRSASEIAELKAIAMLIVECAHDDGATTLPEIAEYFRHLNCPVTVRNKAGEIIDEAEPVKPLDAAQATARAKKVRNASDKLADMQAMNNIKLNAARRRLSQL